MKKLMLILVLITVFSTGAAFADHSDSFGIGAIITFDRVDIYKLSIMTGFGITLKAPYVPVFAGAKFFLFDPHETIMGFTVDYHIFEMPLSETPLIKKISLFSKIRLDWYAGLGIDYQYYHTNNFYDNKIDYYFHMIGLRAPIGLNFHATDKLDVFFELAPTPHHRIYRHKNNRISIYTSAALGVRFLF